MPEKKENLADIFETSKSFIRDRVQSICLGVKIAFGSEKIDLGQIKKALEEGELIKALCETTPNATLLTKSDGEILFVNEKFAARFSEESTEIVGKKIIELFSLEAAKKRMDSLEKAIESKKTVHFYDKWNNRIFENSISPVFSQEEKVVAVAVVSHDITEQRKLISDLAETLDEKEKLITKLQKATAEVKILDGLLPICSSCKKIRDNENHWQQIEKYIDDHSEAKFSHGICPDCEEKLYGDQSWYQEVKRKKAAKKERESKSSC